MVEPQSEHLSEARVARRFIPLGLKFYKLSRRRQSSVRERSARQRREAEEIRRPDLKKIVYTSRFVRVILAQGPC